MEFITDTTGEAMPLPKAFMSEFAKLEKEADELQIPGGIEYDAEIAWLNEISKKSLIDPDEELEEPPIVMSIDSTAFATLGSISCIIGKAKSKKTFAITLLVGSLLKGSTGIIQAHKAKGKCRVMWFDTEMGRYSVKLANKRALLLSEGSSFYKHETHEVGALSTQELLRFINGKLTLQNPDNDIAFVMIDGIKDLVGDINSPDEATNITRWLLKVSRERNLHICSVLHQNKGDLNARGHLGTEMINKCESVISVQKESDNISKVQAEVYRNDKEFNPFVFTIDDGIGLPRILNDYYGGGFTESGSGRPGGAYISDEKHRELMGKIFSIESEYSYGDLLTQVMLHYTDDGFKTGQLKGKGAITKCANLGIIKKDGRVGSKGKYIMTNPV